MVDRFTFIVFAFTIYIQAVCNADPFYTNTRYGKRSQTDAAQQPFSEAAQEDRSEGRRIKVLARNDRFFIGSRYGKRTPPSEEYSLPDINDVQSGDLNRSIRSDGPSDLKSDRFFLGSRYGKRLIQQQPIKAPVGNGPLPPISFARFNIICHYLKIGSSFQCQSENSELDNIQKQIILA